MTPADSSRSTVAAASTPRTVLRSEFNDVELALDERTGLPAGLRDQGRDVAGVALRTRLRLEVDGEEVTAHHIDSHDTFWWRLPGEKWMREQFGIGATRALTGVFALTGGPFMMFVRGEEGIEDDLRTIARLRDTRPELAVDDSDYTAVTVDDPSTPPGSARASRRSRLGPALRRSGWTTCAPAGHSSAR